jgi:tetratricopeptide (TPR) repeat protein
MPESADDPLRRLIHNWPYAREFVLDTMDPELIQRHGELLLSRAVNIGRIVAFVGAGVSMSYGRISWRELVRALLDSAEQKYLETLCEYERKGRAYKDEHPRINIIYETLKALKPPKNADEDNAWREMSPARLLILFQIADELGEAIHRSSKDPGGERHTARRKAQQLVYDDAGHTRRLFESSYKRRTEEERVGGKAAIEQLLGYLSTRPLSRNLLKVQPPYQEIFARATLENLIKDIPPQLRSLKSLCREFGETIASQARPIYLNPTHRFIVAAILSTMTASKSGRRLKEWVPNYIKKASEHSIRRLIEEKEPRRFRNETVDQDRDPLQLLVNRLGVRRFITTNYDLDIEQMMLDRGYQLRSAIGESTSSNNFIAESVNAMEARARDFVFQEERAAHLIDFAVQDGRFALDVVHLHGRATDGDDIVATEADYQRLYLRDESRKGRGRDLLDGAINLAFRGNALLFVGNGMGEDDLLRPLRHFMSEGPSGRESDAIALLPDLKGAQSRLEEKATLLRRYGVYTIHFGRGKLDRNDQEDFLLSALIKLIRFLVKEIAELSSPKKRARKGRGAAISSLLNKIGSELGKGEFQNGATGLHKRLVVAPRVRGARGTLKLAEIWQIEGKPTALIGCELKTINYLLDFCVRATCGSLAEHQTESRAAQILAENTEDAIVAGFLSATISRLQDTWAEWREQWFGDISPRLPVPREEPLEVENTHPLLAAGAKIDRRRAINLPPDYNLLPVDKNGATRNRNSSGGRFRIETSQTLAEACLALSRHVGLLGEGRERRVFVLAGARGTGKGHFFSAISESEGLLKFLDATWKVEGKRPKPKYSSAFAFNFSFSVELGSGFDRLAQFLRDRVNKAYSGNKAARNKFAELYDQIAGRKSALQKPSPPHSGHRIGVLDFLFKAIAGKIAGLPKIEDRLVLLFNATHLLFDAQGFAKSADVTRIMKVLLDEHHANAAIDIIFITDEKGISFEFRDHKDVRSHEISDVTLPEEAQPPKWCVEVIRSPGNHLRSEAEDEAALSRLNLRQKTPVDEDPDAPNNETSTTPNNVAFFLRLRPAMLGIVAAAAFPRTLAAIVYAVREEKTLLSRKRLNRLGMDVQKLLKNESKEKIDDQGVVERYAYVEQIARLGLTKSSKVDRSIVSKIDRELGTFFKAFGGNRFALTVAFAVADEELVVEENTKTAIERTLNRIRDEVSGIDDPSREDSIVRAAIAIHRRRGVRKAAFPEILDKLLRSFRWGPKDRERKETRLFRRLSDICEELLVVLSMIGYPIEQDCLPALQFQAWNGWDQDFKKELTPRIQKAVVEAALQILVQRCLVFRFEPTIVPARPPSRSTAKMDKGTERFGVHRHVQRHIFRQLKQPFVEHAEIESYMPTLYASQPNDLPYPTITAQTRIREIVALLSRYPSYNRLHERSQDREDSAELQSRMLRAAYGTIRTVYGVGVVARFQEFGDKATPPSVGYFEEHRQQVRWLLTQGKEIERRLIDGEPYKKFVQKLPFYSGDIAWLYNECGVLCLVQGRLNDASKLFSVSMRALLPIERRGTPAALTASVRLNRALVDIELGNLPKAEGALRDIIAQQDEHRAVRSIASGYCGLIEHIRGNLGEARSRYDGAVKALVAMKRNRAASIFSRHCADLCRCLKAKDDLKEAERLADNAVNLAAAGSHADVLHQARLSRLRIQAARRGPESFAPLRKELESIEAYAKVMGMPRLEVETAHVDASFRRQLGDLTMAMKAITRSLTIANDCNLVLRIISGTLLAAEISKDLGMPEGARTLAETAKVMATTAEFSAALDNAQSILDSL